ncbi:heterokaryon incompatibility protein-domain-containing protein [Stachybotrys elegans]|uniref:Heterokaryon incompatibility protein-domain-containing protein n=1 Tax=Stachybotrys elegans TaxID=80388 RepID=A0A8K0WL76_9HYPO|nr:heterokaryon incompatibility protein-domain-containing protein [Stachybotrys elegans]
MAEQNIPKATGPTLYQPERLQDEECARYMILQPANTEADPLVCTLHSAHLNEFPTFETISYVWGTPVKKQPVICNGQDIFVTENLAAALRQVRLPEKPRTLWADSICINQADTEERGHQVSLMHQIYKRSKRTLICLGASDHGHATIAAGLVDDVDLRFRSVFGQADFDWSANSFPFPNGDDPLRSHSGWASFGVLLRQPWFKRGWVVQEAALGQDDAVVQWGDVQINWMKLVQAYIWFIRKAQKLPSVEQLWLSDLHLQGYIQRRNREAITFWPEGRLPSVTHLDIFNHARSLDVTDPRDRIYAFLSLANLNETPLLSVQPTYEAPYTHAYRDFAVEYLQKFQDLDILHFVQHDNQTLDSNYPSWIPRWDLRLYSRHNDVLNNYGKFRRRFISHAAPSRATVSMDKATLGVRIMILDTVTFTGPAFDQYSTTPDDVASLWESISMRTAPSPYTCPPLRAFIEIFRCGIYRGRLIEWIALESAYMRLLQHEISEGHEAYDDANQFHKSRMEDVDNKRFIVSERGYHGLAPKAVQEGDLCCLIFGTRSPFILRKTDSAGHYKIVGSMLLLSKESDQNGYPGVMGSSEIPDWAEWGLEEEDAFLC